MSTPPPPSLLTYHTDIVGLFEQTLSSDEVLTKNYPNLLIAHDVSRRAMATTVMDNKNVHNCMVVLNEQRAAKFEWNTGGAAGQQRRILVIDIMARAVETNNQTAVDIVTGIKRRIRELLFGAVYLNTGWLGHTETSAGFPSPPTRKMAYYKLTYEVYVTMG